AIAADAPVDRSPMPVVPGPPMDRRRWRALGIGLALVALVAIVGQYVSGPEGGFLALLDYGLPGRPANSLTTIGLTAWLLGTALYLWSLADRGVLERLVPREGDGLTIHISIDAIAVLLITAVAAYFRFFDIDGLPYQMTSDHTEKLLDIAAILAGQRPVFLPLNAGREPMQFYYTALLVKLGMPLSFHTLKVGMALISTLTIPAVYWLGREVVGRRVGMFAALVIALAPWHLQITRIALRIPLSPLFAALVLAALYRALADGRRNTWLAVGGLMGLGMYGYSGFRPMALAAPLVVAIRLAYDAWRARSAGRDAPLLSVAAAGHMAASIGAALMVATPLIRYALDQPEWFWGRTLSRVSSSEVPLEHPPLQQFLVNLKNALLMFNVTNDSAWFHSPPGRPALETVGGALLILGVVTAAIRVWRGDWRLASLVPVVPVMLLASAMAIAFPIEVPHLSRAAGALPAVAVLAALPLWLQARQWRKAGGWLGSILFLALAAVLFAFMAWGTSERVFVEYRAGYDQSTHPTRQGAEVGRAFVDMGGDLDHIFLVSWPHGWDYRALGMLLGDPEWSNVLEGFEPNMEDAVDLAADQVGDPARKLYLVGGPIAQQNIAALLELYPDAVVTHHDVPVEGKDFWSVFVPPQFETDDQ
ncbi:MAG: glycosyltransferase family 39 protein, partial [Anaerolineae bacterium]